MLELVAELVTELVDEVDEIDSADDAEESCPTAEEVEG